MENSENEDEFIDQTNNYILNNDTLEMELNTHKDLNILKSATTVLGVVSVNCQGKTVSFLVDPGSTVSLIEESVANELRISGPEQPLNLKWSGNQGRADDKSRVIKLRCENANNKLARNYYFHTVKDLEMYKQRFVANEFKKFKHLENLNLKDYLDIDGVIGEDNPLFYYECEYIKGSDYREPIGVKHPLCDFIKGTKKPLKDIYDSLMNDDKSIGVVNVHYNFRITQDEQTEYENMERKALNLLEEKFDAEERENYENKTSLEMLEKDVKFDEKLQKYITPLLWKDENEILPCEESKTQSLRRFLIIEKVLNRDGKFHECEKQINNLVEKGYARELNQKEINNVGRKSFYMPIFFIYPENKRLRMIWDGAAKVNGKSINDYLFTGPNLYNNLTTILFQLREYKYIIKGDLSEMFHQVSILEEDTDCLRFLFRFSGETKIREFKMTVLPFGLCCAPTIAQFVKNLIAKSIKNESPLTSDIMQNSTYVDDAVTSVDNFEDAIFLIDDLKKKFKTGGFNLVKINSNSLEILERAKSLLDDEEKLFCNERIEKLLGYIINFENDTISLDINVKKIMPFIDDNKIPTKRDVLSILMSNFDPFGLGQFVTCNMKIVYKHIIAEQIDWDDVIPEKLLPEWQRAVKKLIALKDLKIPRQLMKEKYAKIELHAFGDAGKEMLCGVIYFKFLNEENEYLSHQLIYAKTFTVPNKEEKRTIPELELQISTNFIKMTEEVIKSHRVKIEKVYYYTDSTTVYTWIKHGCKKASIYTKNRLNKITNGSDPQDWNWVSTDMMPADFGTKEITTIKVEFSNPWFQPEYFKLSEREKDSMREKLNETLTFNTTRDELTENKTFFDWDKYNKIDKFITNLQYIFRFIDMLKTCTKAKKMNLSDDCIKEMKQKIHSKMYKYQEAKLCIIKAAQAEKFSDNAKFFKNNLYFRDNYGVIKIQNRLNIETCQKLQETNLHERIWLPKEHKITNLIILEQHENEAHILTNNVVAKLHKIYYIEQATGYIKKVIRNCMFCKRFNRKKVCTPLMGDLPIARVGYGDPPFSYVMTDVAGPILVKQSRNCMVKRYILLYTCLTTRATHLEILDEMTANSTIKALINCFHLRGIAKEIFSDQGTNYLGAKNTIEKVFDEWNSELIKRELTNEPIKWVFGAARAPHFQGAAEILIKLTKRAIEAISQRIGLAVNNITEGDLRCIILEVAAMLNNRPLCDVPIPELGELLTPNSFLLMRLSNELKVPYWEMKKTDLLSNWKNIKNITQVLWKHWKDHYLPTIMQRKRWKQKEEKLEVGDLVLTIDTDTSNSWRLARIESISTGSKDQTRQATVIFGKRGTAITLKLSKKEILKKYKEENIIRVTRAVTSMIKIYI